ncbi:hypothetical protein GW17_00059915 [Ensete ventricosum]|nr:hypothetical protein GW17_00059915 [Ensete ventricosum]
MTDLPPSDPDAPLEAWWSSLKQRTKVWADGADLVEYAWGMLIHYQAACGGHRQVLEIGGFRDGPGADRLGFIRVWLWVDLAQFKARYPDLEIEEDPFVLLPEDKTVPMEAKQPFDNSLPLLEG